MTQNSNFSADGHEEELRQTTENNPKVLGIYIFTFFYWTFSDFRKEHAIPVINLYIMIKKKVQISDMFIVARDTELRNT